MCGIFAYSGNRLAGSLVFQALKDLEYRGYDSWGIVLVDSHHQLHRLAKTGKLPSAQPKLAVSHLALGHTRWATHGGITSANAHPHLDCSQSLAVVHNGIIENFLDLKQKLITQGHQFTSETDTEVIAHLVEQFQTEGHSFLEAVKLTARQLQGLNSFLVLSAKTQELIAFHLGSPLVFGQRDQDFFLSSDIPALLKFTSTIYPLQPGEGIYLCSQQANLIKLNSSQPTSPKLQTVSFSLDETTKGKFKHYLLKEIHDIPQVIERLAHLPATQFKPLANLFRQTSQHFLVAAGTAHHANLLGTYFLANRGISSRAVSSSEFLHFQSLLNPQTLVLAASQSGETIDTLEAIRLAKTNQAKTAALVNVPASTLTREVDYTFYLQAGREQAVLSTKAYLAKIATYYLLAAALTNQFNSAQAELAQLPQLLTSLYAPAYQRRLQALAKQLLSASHLYLLGKGVNYPTALEGALKIKEASYLHAEGFAAGELKHGVIALIEPDTPVIVIGAEDETKADLLSNMMEVKARGAKVIGLASFNHPEFDFHLPVPDSSHLSPFLNIVPLQLLAYYLTLIKGYDPDKPRNLAKSVTVK